MVTLLLLYYFILVLRLWFYIQRYAYVGHKIALTLVSVAFGEEHPKLEGLQPLRVSFERRFMPV